MNDNESPEYSTEPVVQMNYRNLNVTLLRNGNSFFYVQNFILDYFDYLELI